MVKNPPANAGDMGLTPGLGRLPGEGTSNPLQYSCWKIPWTEEHGRLQSMRSQRVRHDLSTEYVRMYTLLKGRVHAVYLFASKMKFTTEKI